MNENKINAARRSALGRVGLGIAVATTAISNTSKAESAVTGPSPIVLDRFDHIVLTVADIDKTCEFYVRALGVKVEVFGAGRKALVFGRQKFNLHQVNHEIAPYAKRPTPGSADLCIIAVTPVEQVIAHLKATGVPIEAGPVPRTGAMGPIKSVYFRDPDENLIEIANYS